MAITENERRILGELSRQSPLSKRDITARCEIGWATAVKLMTRLEEQGYLLASGNERQKQAGKSATVYTLSPRKPAALGIDIEYVRARLNVRNLAGECLIENTHATPRFQNVDELVDFLSTLLSDAVTNSTAEKIALEGAGIGVPSHLFGVAGVPYAQIAETLTRRIGFPVTVDNNIRCFTAGIINSGKTPRSLLVVTIRSGIGVGIVMDGRIYQGERGCSGEIGHFPTVANGLACRCGKFGCLETVVNRDSLLADLNAAVEGDHAAEQRIREASAMLGKAIASMMVVLDIRNVVVYAELSELGRRLLASIRAAAQEAVYPGFDFHIRFETLDAEAYVAGAARLVLDEFVR